MVCLHNETHHLFLTLGEELLLAKDAIVVSMWQCRCVGCCMLLLDMQVCRYYS